MSILNFVLSEDPTVLKPILTERLPRSCFIYNQLISNTAFNGDLKFYTVGTEINLDTWIVVDYIREDYGHNFSISAPLSIINGKQPIPAEVKKCFSAGGSLIDWNDGMVFIALEKVVSGLIFDISVNLKGNVTEAHPCTLYFMENEDAKNLSISWSPEIEVRKLTKEEAGFITSTWKYSIESTEGVFQKCIEANPSAGVFVDGKCVAGVLIPGNGLISALYTLKEFRNRGYAKLIMHYIYKECGKNGFIPCSTVEVKNVRSLAFHDKLGATVGWTVDFIDVRKLVID